MRSVIPLSNAASTVLAHGTFSSLHAKAICNVSDSADEPGTLHACDPIRAWHDRRFSPYHARSCSRSDISMPGRQRSATSWRATTWCRRRSIGRSSSRASIRVCYRRLVTDGTKSNLESRLVGLTAIPLSHVEQAASTLLLSTRPLRQQSRPFSWCFPGSSPLRGSTLTRARPTSAASMPLERYRGGCRDGPCGSNSVGR